jgi:hypothetical protein
MVLTLNMTAEQLACIRLLANAAHFKDALPCGIDAYAIPPARMAALREVLDANGIEANWPVQYARRQERKEPTIV